MNKLCIFIAILFLQTLPAFAETPQHCIPKFDAPAKKYFAESIVEAQKAIKAICKAIGNKISEQKLQNTLQSFHNHIQTSAAIKMPQISEYFAVFDSPLLKIKNGQAKGHLPDIYIDRGALKVNYIELYYKTKGPKVYTTIPQLEAQRCFDNTECRLPLEGYRQILNSVYIPLAVESIFVSLKYLTEKDEEWIKYIDTARGQTFVDIAFTSTLYEWVYKNDKKHDFSSPPSVQWFALRPNVLIENVSDAIDGEQVKESVALEVIGFNAWNDGCFGYACGASVIVNYVDRNGIDDKGYGLMFHLDNKYSFGVTKHGDDTGVFVTVDLLKLFQDKKSSFDDYKDKYRKLAE